MMSYLLRIGLILVALATPAWSADAAPYLIVLGTAQDGGVPQTGDTDHPAWQDPTRSRYVVSLAVVDPVTSQRWLFECTPDFKQQLHMLDETAPARTAPGLDGIFLTHAHIGHYSGLMFLGHESMGAAGVPVFAMPRMSAFLRNNGPWSQLVRYKNIALKKMAAGEPVSLNNRITVTPFLVPHRQEFSEVVGYRIEGPNRSVLFIPDIDSWEEWHDQGTAIEEQIASVDAAYLDATFYANGEIPGRDMSGFPHPFISHSMDRFQRLTTPERAKIRFIHFNHTNPVLDPDSRPHAAVYKRGYRLAKQGERLAL